MLTPVTQPDPVPPSDGAQVPSVSLSGLFSARRSDDSPGRSDTGLPEGPPAGPAWRRLLPALLTAVAVGMHLVMVVPYAASGLLAPGWAVALLAVWWLVLAVVLLVLALRRRVVLALLVPVVALLTWVGVVRAGEVWLGWTG